MNAQEAEVTLTIIKNIPNSLVVVFDLDFTYTFAEGEGFAKTGLASRDLIGKNIHEVLSPEELLFFHPIYTKVIQGEIIQFEYTHYGLNILHNFFPQYQDEKIIGGILISQNITSLKTAQNLLKLSEERYELAMKSSNTGIFDWNVITDVTYRSPRLWQIFELEDGEEDSTFNSFAKYIHPKDFEHLKIIFSKDMLKNVFNEEYRIYTKTNQLKWIQSSGLVIKNQEGSAIRFVGSIVDITERKDVEHQLVESEEKFRELISYLPISVALYNNKGEEVFSNNSLKYYGQYFDKNHSYVTENGNPIEYSNHPVLKVLATGEPHKSIVLGVNEGKGDGVIWLNVSAIPIKKQGMVEKIICTYTDITTLKKTREEALETSKILLVQNKQLEEFAHITSHNLRAPISNLNLLVNLYKKSKIEVEKDLYVSKIEEVSAHLHQTIDVLAKSLQIKKEIHKTGEVVKFEEIFAQTKLVLSGQLASIRAKINTDFVVSEILYPRIYLESIFQNLISNTIKYRHMHRVLQVGVRTYQSGGRVVLEVEDNGVGINLERNRNKIFGLYKTFHENKDARGVGLFLVKSQVDAMGSTITLESKEGIGTKFKIIF